MYIDPRVAHSLAREGLQHARQPLRDIAARASVALQVLYTQLPRDHSMRALRRNIPKHLDKLSRNLDAEVTMHEDGGVLRLLFTRTTVTEDGVCAHQFVIDCVNWAVAHKPMVRITEHALARLMQRCGTMNFEDVRTPVAEAVGRATALMDKATDEGWLQYGIPAAGGMFVGQLDAEDTLVLASWFVPGLTGQATRWEEYMHDLGAPKVDLSSKCTNDSAAADRYFESLNEWVEGLDVRELAVRHPFLLKLHHAQSEVETTPFPILHRLH